MCEEGTGMKDGGSKLGGWNNSKYEAGSSGIVGGVGKN